MLLALVIVFAVGGCSGGSSTFSPAIVSTQTPGGNAAPVTSDADQIDCTACWPTYAHDYQRTGLQPQTTGINAGNVARLTPRWAVPLNEQIITTPIVDNGMVFITTGAGNVYAFNSSNGTVLWKRNLGAQLAETPTVDHGVLFVGTHQAPATFYALDVRTGAVIWQKSVSGTFRGPAAVSNGVVYVGEANGDPPHCDPGGVHAYQAATGAQLFFWRTDPKPQDGGAVWTPITLDGANIVFGTGNTCSNGVANGNSLIRLTAAGTQEWQVPDGDPSITDDDWGGAVTAHGGRYYAVNKNGLFYAIDPSTGSVVWKKVLSPLDAQGSIGTPTTDGSVLIVPSGNLLDVAAGSSTPTANFSAFSLTGRLLWSQSIGVFQRNYAPIADGIAYLAHDAAITAVDAHTGKVLWAYAASGGVEFVGAPVVTPEGLFTADTDGAVIVFAPATSAAAAASSKIKIRRGPLYEPYGPIVRKRAGAAPEIPY